MMAISFTRSVATLASGTIVAQIITFACIPFITRLFDPTAIGSSNLFTSLVLLGSTFASMAYPIAIALPKDVHDAKAIGYASVAAATLCSIVIGTALYFWADELTTLLNLTSFGSFGPLIPIAIIFSTIQMVSTNWLMRMKEFGIAATGSLISSIGTNFSKILFGILHPSASSLIFIAALSPLLTAAVTHTIWKTKQAKKIHKVGTISISPRYTILIAKRYSDFPSYRMPQNLINAISFTAPLILIGSLFNHSAAGQYSIAIATLLTPATLLGNAISSAIYPRIAEAVNANQPICGLIVRTTKATALISAPIYLIVFWLGDRLFPLILGYAWKDAGLFAQLLAPWMFLQLINKPSVAALPAIHQQRGLLVYEIFSTTGKLTALWIGFGYFRDVLWSIGLYSFVGSIAYIWLIAWAIKKATDHDGKETG